MTAPASRQAFDAAMRRQLAAAGAVILAERAMARELGAVLSVWSLYIAAALFGLAVRLPGELRLALLALLIVVSAGLVARAVRRLGLPTRAARRARLERGGGLPRGLLSLRDEQPAGDMDAFGALLWARAQGALQAARPRLGRPEWQASLEVRYGLLPLVGTALFLGLVSAKDDAATRLAGAFSPYATSLAGVRATINVDAPDYAGALPRRIVIAGGGRGRVTALAGSSAGVRVEGAADWYVRSPGGGTYPGANGRASVPIGRGGEYAIMSGRRELAALDVTIAADRAPVIRFDGEPAQTPSGALRLGYRLSDDHGAAALSLRLRRGTAERAFDLETSAPSGRAHVFADLTPHPFAGSDVELRIAARDGAGHTGVSPPIVLRLPERRFTNPLAREIVAVRKALLFGAGRVAVIDRLNAIAAVPERYDADPAVYAGLRAAGWRLVHDRREAARESSAAVLWDIAADLEDGGASRAMDDLRAAMERLTEGLNGGDDQALAAMAEQLEAAMGDYLRRQIEAAMAEGGAPAGGGAGVSVDLGFLDQMFADLKDRMAAGDSKGAAEALANLRQLMETIRFGGGAPDPEAEARAAQAGALARQLREIETRQGTLRDRTIADMIRASFGADDALRASAGTQRELERAVGGLLEGFGDASIRAPAELGAAAQAMGEAAAALARGNAGDAIRAQTRALEALQQAGNAAEAAAERMAQMAGPGAMQPGAAGSGLDPLGRPGTGFGQGAVELPDAAEVRRIQAIRKILEERASDPSRSAGERGYYLRLLKRF